MKMTLHEAIEHCDEVAKQNRELFEKIGTSPHDDYNCLDCAEAHEQLRDWLIELDHNRQLYDLIHKQLEHLKAVEHKSARKSDEYEQGRYDMVCGMIEAVEHIKSHIDNL